jgi:hypothetical protein
VDAVANVTGVCVPPPVCVKVWLNAASTVPVVVDGFVTVIVWQEMTRLYVALVPVQPFASVTFTTIGKVPFFPGVPERTPADESVSPLGSVEVVEKVTEPVPPDCVKAWLKAASTVPVAVDGFVTVIVGQVVTRLYDVAPTQPAASVAVTVTGNVPGTVGVPERTPPENVIPGGNAPVSVKVYGLVPPDAVNVTGPYAVPTGPDASDGGATVIVTPLHVTVMT